MKKGLVILILSLGVLCFNKNVLSTGFSTNALINTANSTVDDRPTNPNITGLNC